MSRVTPLIVAALLVSAPLCAQVAPNPSDTRIREIGWTSGLTLSLEVEAGGTLVMLPPEGERVERAVLAEGGQFEVSIPYTGDIVFVRPLAETARTGMALETDLASYNFELHASTAASVSRIVRIANPSNAEVEVAALTVPEVSRGSWNLRGDRAVRPETIIDDGTRIFIAFAEQQALPAVFAVGPTGEEQVVDGYMRDGIFVIDRLHDELVFRIDKEKAEAHRREASG